MFGVANPTVDRYIDLLVDLQLLRRLRPWSGNVGKRLIKSPKFYVRDSGILRGLLELEAVDDLRNTQRYVVYPGSEKFALRPGAQAIGLVELTSLLHGDTAV